MPKVKAEDWVTELVKVMDTAKEDNGLLTKRELMQRLGKSNEYVTMLLHKANDRGMLELGRKRMLSLAGVMASVPAYGMRKGK